MEINVGRFHGISWVRAVSSSLLDQIFCSSYEYILTKSLRKSILNTLEALSGNHRVSILKDPVESNENYKPNSIASDAE